MNKSSNILKRLELLHPKKIDLSLDRLRKLLRKLDNPHLKLPPVIHVAGTNGKGSVISYLRSIYEKNGKKVHTYTSPHLIRFNERIRINSTLVNNKYLSSLLEECEDKNNGQSITFFEITTAAAFLAFSRIDSDLVLLETGLGGKYDATNIIENSLCSILTPISMDHMNFLGTNLLKIANEKVGILKKKSIIVLSKQKKSIRQFIRNEAKKKKASLFEEGINWKIVKILKNSFILNFCGSNYEFKRPSLHGNHQIENASTALASVLAIKKFKLDMNKINQGVKSTMWPGRMQNLNNGKLKKIVGKNFDIWLDGGHNVHASEVLFTEINKWKNSKIVLILGMVSGKDPVKFLKNIVNKISLLILLPIDDHQYIQPYVIKESLNKSLKGFSAIETCVNLDEALRLILSRFKKGKILVCGSLYLAGQVLKNDGFKIS
ncbi:MAG: bifunctional folylpolyglutamate synthase/dihydrofolate synthase [Rickettsiales bacterium]|nr:bifunctional folylpolyglutamate synthase/dihydrofolate synthase [Rickettsiales bacterium]